jgi:hypothetical protein
MKRQFVSTLLVGGLLAVGNGANAQAGYFAFDEIPGIDSEPSVEIDLGPEMMRFFGEATKGAQAPTGLEGITNVRVRVYQGVTQGGETEVLKFIDDTSRTLERDGWRSVVRVNEDGERVRIFMKIAASGANEGSIEGLTVMVVDTGGDNEAVFINVAGAIKPEQLGRVASRFGMEDVFGRVPGAGVPDKGSPQD